MICESLFLLSALIHSQADLLTTKGSYAELDIDREYMDEARLYINSKVTGCASFIRDGKLYMVRFQEIK